MTQKQTQQKAEAYYDFLYRGTNMGKSIQRIVEGALVGAFLMSITMGIAPGIVNARQEGRLSVLADRLHRVRSRIAVYRAEHDGLLPGQVAEGQAVDEAAFVRALTQTDSFQGRPYLRSMPDNPFMAEGTVPNSVTCVYDPEATPSGDEGTAWWFNAATGQFTACDSAFHAAY